MSPEPVVSRLGRSGELVENVVRPSRYIGQMVVFAAVIGVPYGGQLLPFEFHPARWLLLLAVGVAVVHEVLSNPQFGMLFELERPGSVFGALYMFLMGLFPLLMVVVVVVAVWDVTGAATNYDGFVVLCFVLTLLLRSELTSEYDDEDDEEEPEDDEDGGESEGEEELEQEEL